VDNYGKLWITFISLQLYYNNDILLAFAVANQYSRIIDRKEVIHNMEKGAEQAREMANEFWEGKEVELSDKVWKQVGEAARLGSFETIIKTNSYGSSELFEFVSRYYEPKLVNQGFNVHVREYSKEVYIGWREK